MNVPLLPRKARRCLVCNACLVTLAAYWCRLTHLHSPRRPRRRCSRCHTVPPAQTSRGLCRTSTLTEGYGGEQRRTDGVSTGYWGAEKGWGGGNGRYEAGRRRGGCSPDACPRHFIAQSAVVSRYITWVHSAFFPHGACFFSPRPQRVHPCHRKRVKGMV